MQPAMTTTSVLVYTAPSSSSSVAPPAPVLLPPLPSNRSELAHCRLYDFAKAALIKIFGSPYVTVCDLYCGGGADMDKWDEAQIGHYVGIDSSSSGINEVREMWESQPKAYTAEFCDLDPSAEDLESCLQDMGIPTDLVCCLQHLQVCFDSEERARNLMCNVSRLLKPGGFFFGITPDSSTIWTKYQKNVEALHNKGGGVKTSMVPNCIRSENYVITFESEEEKFPFFGKKYQLKFSSDVTSETHCLVHFPSLIRLAREAGLEYVEIQNLTEFYDDNRPQFAGILSSFGANFVDMRGKLLARSFDLLGLYAMFVFQKPDPDVVPPIFSPLLQNGSHMNEENEWLGSAWRQPTTADEDRDGQPDTTTINHSGVLVELDKGILGPGPADLRFPEPL